jgi:hypothetical protein
MKLSQRILRFINPEAEAERQNFRMARAMSAACAEELTRTIVLNQDEITKAITKYQQSLPKTNGGSHGPNGSGKD